MKAIGIKMVELLQELALISNNLFKTKKYAKNK